MREQTRRPGSPPDGGRAGRRTAPRSPRPPSDQRLPAHSTRSTRNSFDSAPRGSNVADGDDLVATGAARRRHVDHVALGLADQRARDGRGDRQQPLLDVRLVVADQLVARPWRRRPGPRVRRVAPNTTRPLAVSLVTSMISAVRQPVLDLVDAPLDEALLLARRVIFGVLATDRRARAPRRSP